MENDMRFSASYGKGRRTPSILISKVSVEIFNAVIDNKSQSFWSERLRMILAKPILSPEEKLQE